MQSLSFAKLVATPNDTSWSQVYNAGNLFACLSLSKNDQTEESSLGSIGKEMFSNLESEFFTLENKDLQSIKEAIANSSHSVPSSVTASLCVAFFKENILYVFIFGKGKITIKRSLHIGTLLEGSEDLVIKSASGFAKNGDIIILQTSQFAKDIEEGTIAKALELELPNDIAESLSPGMHTTSETEEDLGSGSLAAIIIRFQEAVRPEDQEENLLEDDEATIQTVTTHTSYSDIKTPGEEIEILEQTHQHQTLTPEKDDDDDFIKPQQPENKKPFSPVALLKSLIPKNKIDLNHRNKLFISIAAIILVLLVLSIFFTKKNQSATKTQERFHAVYDPALKYYEEGEGIKSINKEFATSDFQKAQQTLTNAQPQFKKGSSEEKQIEDLLTKVKSELPSADGSNKTLDRSALGITVLNGSGVPGAAKGISDYLSGLGYAIQSTDNADNYNYKNITVKIKTSATSYLPLLKKDLSAKSSTTPIASSVDDSISTDAEVIVGK